MEEVILRLKIPTLTTGILYTKNSESNMKEIITKLHNVGYVIQVCVHNYEINLIFYKESSESSRNYLSPGEWLIIDNTSSNAYVLDNKEVVEGYNIERMRDINLSI